MAFEERTGMVLLMNILHSPERTLILKEASRIMRRTGKVAVIHWRKDIPTPRGPSVESLSDLPLTLELVAGRRPTPVRGRENSRAISLGASSWSKGIGTAAPVTNGSAVAHNSRSRDLF